MIDNYQLSITDKSGNNTTITVNIDHVCNFVDGVCSVCGKLEYEEIELTENNLYMTGLTSSAEDYNTPVGEVIIPSIFEYNNKKYKTTSINCTTTSLVLPNTLTTIKSLGGFRNCKYVTIPESVTTIDRNPIDYFDYLDILYWNTEHINDMNLANTNTFDNNINNTYKIVFGENVSTIPYIFAVCAIGSSDVYYSRIKEIDIKNPELLLEEELLKI